MVVVPVLVLTGIAILLLLVTTHPTTAAERIDVVKTALSVGAGTGGVVALVLTGRRQWHVEQAQRATEKSHQAAEHDATERRITELYGKAVEQLGSDKAPIRLGGLYALERLAQDNPGQRQTIVEVICGYLRMPYEPPVGPPDITAPAEARAEHRNRVEEQQVRLTAQDILIRHLHPDRSTFWPDTDLNLKNATLIDIRMDGCRVRRAEFGGAKFVNEARLDQVEFIGDASFDHVQFSDDVSFNHVQFSGHTLFNYAQFSGSCLVQTRPVQRQRLVRRGPVQRLCLVQRGRVQWQRVVRPR